MKSILGLASFLICAAFALAVAQHVVTWFQAGVVVVAWAWIIWNGWGKDTTK